ncbi:hypothetical protein M408DRAFT_204570 [Serendipita vermifera MAFF 305830]|uniref:Uncharacterized protein n=1 Tax=Serendipita vermifera MAFF 305830 TaxID=933852 RepID=A0A0C3B2R0_SERVB|nr:hypothetical protein M408DRAFT_204570 [Serendipita vermifera MAFF 305830]
MKCTVRLVTRRRFEISEDSRVTLGPICVLHRISLPNSSEQTEPKDHPYPNDNLPPLMSPLIVCINGGRQLLRLKTNKTPTSRRPYLSFSRCDISQTSSVGR